MCVHTRPHDLPRVRCSVKENVPLLTLSTPSAWVPAVRKELKLGFLIPWAGSPANYLGPHQPGREEVLFWPHFTDEETEAQGDLLLLKSITSNKIMTGTDKDSTNSTLNYISLLEVL